MDEGEPPHRAVSLDYAAPEPTPVRNSAVVRFTAGAGLPCLGLFAAGVWYGDDMACCSAVGLVLEIAMIGGVFSVGQRLCRRWRGRPLVERNRAATFVVGVVTGGSLLGLLYLSDRAGLDGTRQGAAAVVPVFLLATATGPWWVFGSEPAAT